VRTRSAHCALPSFIAATLALVAMGNASAQEASRPCLPMDLRLSVAFAEPKRLAGALKELEGERKQAGKRAVLERRFAEAGCASVEKQGGPGFAEPNLICRIPGRSSATIAIGTSPMVDGWAAAALLPELARAITASPREHSYAIALLSRAVFATPAGAREFADSFGDRPPLIFVHPGVLGSQLPEVGPEADDEQRCVVQSIARAVAGARLKSIVGWEQVSTPCRTATVPSLRGAGSRGSALAFCGSVPFGRLLDVDPFVRGDVSVVGLYAFPDRERDSRIDAAAYVATYRVLAAYSVALDALLAASPRPTDEAAASTLELPRGP
jgi:hypothetical protein